MSACPQDAMQAKLLNLKTGYKVNVDRCATTIGRAGDNDVAVTTDRSVSRQHALVLNIRNNYFLEDLGSRNGTRLNGKPVMARMLLKSGDQITIGMTVLMFHAPAIPPPMSALSQTQDFPIIPATGDPVRSELQNLRRIAPR